MNEITHGELFAGIGGFTVGAEIAGVKTLWHVEIDANCQSVLRKHFPGAIIHDDVCECGSENLEPVDIITFGSPCQDLSIAGKRNGLDGKRSGLFFEAVRIISELRPKFAIWENVPGALSSNKGEDFRAVLSALVDADVPMPRSGRWARSGMVRNGQKEVAWRILDAQYFGVAQRRRRLFAVLDTGDGRAAEILFEREGVRRDTPPSRKARQETAGDAATSTLRSFGHGLQNSNNDTNAVVVSGVGHSGGATLKLNEIANSLTQQTGSETTAFLNAVAIDCRNNNVEEEVSTPIQTKGNGGFSLNFINPVAVMNRKKVLAFGGNNTSGDIDVATYCNAHGGSGRMDFESETFVTTIWEMSHASEAVRDSGDLSPCLQQRMGTGGNQVPLVGIRRLTPTECERLQGFPDGWTEIGMKNGEEYDQADSPRYRQLGNAVAVPVVAWILNRVVRFGLT